jgi:hypothetical protein
LRREPPIFFVAADRADFARAESNHAKAPLLRPREFAAAIRGAEVALIDRSLGTLGEAEKLEFG